MPTGKHDNDSWRKKLERLDQLPGQAFDKTTTWEKLETKLREKKPRKKIGWFWPIAASVLIIALLAIFLFPSSKDKKPDIARSFIKIPTITIQEKQVLVSDNKKENVVYIKNDKPTIELPKQEEKEKEEEQAIVVSAPVDTTSKAIASATPVKKKPRVVHINDVVSQNNTAQTEEPEPTRSVANNTMPLFRRPVVNNNETYYNSENITPVTKHKKPLLPFGSASPKD